MISWKDALISSSTTIREALQVIDKCGTQAAFVTSDNGMLLGIITDGDVRRGILRGVDLNGPVTQVWNTNPKSVRIGTSRDAILNIMKKSVLRQIPILDQEGRLVNVEFIDDLINPGKRENFVVLMAGGLGKRLYPLTQDCPKPLLKVGDKPIMEIIINGFVKKGFTKFFLAVNYKAEMVESYFGDGSKWGVEINYLREQTKMGTAGALSLLPPTDHPVLVMNGDLLTTVSFDGLLEFHIERRSVATMCVRTYNHEVPFGVVEIDDHAITKIVEKPNINFFVNGGIYVLDPKALSRVPKDRQFDMPELFNALIKEGQTIAAFPVREYWLDIGRADDYERAVGEVQHVLGLSEK